MRAKYAAAALRQERTLTVGLAIVILTSSCNGMTAVSEITEHTIDRGDGFRVQLFQARASDRRSGAILFVHGNQGELLVVGQEAIDDGSRVRFSLRHHMTEYETLLLHGMDREEALRHVSSHVLRRCWRCGEDNLSPIPNRKIFGLLSAAVSRLTETERRIGLRLSWRSGMRPQELRTLLNRA